MKRKFLLLAAALMCSVGSWAGITSGSDYLIKNIETGYYLVGGMDWGTHACLHKMPQWFTFTGGDGSYTLDSHQFNGINNHFLGSGLYVDQTTTDWTVSETATSGVYTISIEGSYLAGNGIDAAITTTIDGTATAAQWQLISKSDFENALAGATLASGVDATPYIKDPELKRNGNFTTWNDTKPWTITSFDGSADAGNFAQGQNGNNASCAESFQSSNGFKVVQTLTGLKPGKYQLTAQAFYRQDGEDNTNLPYLFVDEQKSNFPVRTGSENDMVAAYTSFLAGTYPVSPISFIVTSTSQVINIGYANENVKMWNIFGQTQLTYYGNAVEVYSPSSFTSGGIATADTWYAFTVSTAGYYKISSAAATTIRYTQDNSVDADNGGSTVALAASGYTLVNLSTGTFYFKSSAGDNNSITIEALSATNGTDVTSLFIANPSFETGDDTGWSTNAGLYIRNASELSNKVETHYGMLQGKTTNREVHQTVSNLLPVGKYVLSVNARADGDAGTVTLNLGDNSTPIPSGAGASVYTVAYETAEGASPEIKIAASDGAGNLRRCYFDNFIITYYSTLPDVSVTSLTSEPMDGAVRAALVSASTTYAGNKTAVNYNALQTAIINAKESIADFEAKTGADADWTSIIHNPSFELGGTVSTSPGWSLNGGNCSSSNENDPMKSGQLVDGGGSYFMNYWTNSTTGSKVYQTIYNLPAGTYKLSAYVLTSAGTPITLKAGEVTNTAVAPDGSAFKMETYFTLASKQNIEIAVGTTQTSDAWYNIDHIQLISSPTMPSVTAVEGIMNSTVASTQTSAIITYEGSQTVDNLNAALNAIAAAKGSIYYYSEALGILNAASALDAAGQSSYAANETVVAIQSAYDGRTLTSVSNAQKTTCSAAYVAAVKVQTTAGSDMTGAITNPSFDSKDKTGWTITETSHGNQQYGSYTAESWNNNNVKYSQDISGLHAGIYQLTAQVDNGRENDNVSLFVSDGTTEKTSLATYRAISSYSSTSEDLIANEALCHTFVIFPVAADNTTLTIGVKDVSTGNGWMIFDNFKLTYVGASLPASIDDVTGTLYVGTKNAANTAIADYNTAIGNYNSDQTSYNYSLALEAYDAAMAAIDAADNSKATYASVTAEDRAEYWSRMSELLASTNVYTAAAYNKWFKDVEANYAAGVYTDDEVVLLTENGACQGATETAHKKANHIDEVLLSTWTIGDEQCSDYTKSLYINTWSVEGNSDGSHFQTPFFEYWTSDANSLGEATMVSTMTGLEPNTYYSLDICARVRERNDAEKMSGTITLALSNGIRNLDLTQGIQVGDSKFYMTENYQAWGKTDAEGNLTITITVEEGSNISWLAFKDLMVKPKASVTVSAKAGKYGTVTFPFTPDVTSGFEGIKFYSCTGVVNEYVQITEVAEPAANTPYIIKNTTGSDFSTTITDWDKASNASYIDGLLTGSCSSLEVKASDSSYKRYVLQTLNGKQAFYLVDEDFELPAYKCYLTIPNGVSVKAFFFPEETTPTAINDIAEENDENAAIYNLAGQRLTKLQKGVNIVNGKKVLVK